MKNVYAFFVLVFATVSPVLAAPASVTGTPAAPHPAFTQAPKQDAPAAKPSPETPVDEDAISVSDVLADVMPQAPKKIGGPQAPFLALNTQGAKGVIGDMQMYTASYEDTLVDIAQKFNIGYVELRAANPGVDAWLPGSGTKLVIPTRHLLPDVAHKGIVVNLSEMRLYYYGKDGRAPETFPIGVGREGFSTPTGITSVLRKTKDPIWRPTPRMLKEVPDLDPVVGPGPDNPLGDRAMYLGWPSYLIHGTNKPWGVGRRVSSGCVRMYPNDVRKLFEQVAIGTQVTVIRQPDKVGWVDDMLYVEISPDGAQADYVENQGERPSYSVPADLFTRLKRVAGKRAAEIDWEAVRQAAKDRYGYPVPVLKGWKADAYMKVSGMERPAQVSNMLSESDIDAAMNRYTPQQLEAAEEAAAKGVWGRDAMSDRGEEADAASATKKNTQTHYQPRRKPNGGYN